MKRYTNEQAEQLSYLKKDIKLKNTNNYVLSENSAKENITGLGKEIYRYPFYKKILAYELELY